LLRDVHFGSDLNFYKEASIEKALCAEEVGEKRFSAKDFTGATK